MRIPRSGRRVIAYDVLANRATTRPTNASAAQSSQVVTRHCPNGVVTFALIETICPLGDPARYSCREGTALGVQFLTAGGIGLTNSR